MSLVHLTSVGQMPNQFSNHFSNGIQLGPHSEVALIGYSGNLAGEEGDNDEVFEIVINKETNDTLTYYHGDVSNLGTAAGLYYSPQICKIQPGIYNPVGFGAHLQQCLNDSERVSQYKGMWTVTYNPAPIVGPPAIPAFTYTIKCGKRRAAAANTGGIFINYNTGNQEGVTNGGASSTLNPWIVGPPAGEAVSFINTQNAYMGDTTFAQGSLASSVGYEMSFTTVAATTNADIAYSLCMVPKQMASRMEYSKPSADYPEDSDLIWTGQTAPGIDFAYGPGGANLFGFCPHGITINPADGRFGIIQAKTQNVTGDPKSPNNWDIAWTAINVNVAGPGLKKMGMSPRYSAGIGPVIDYLVDNGTGVWQLLGSVIIDGDMTTGDIGTYRYSTNFYCGVVCASPTVASPNIRVRDANDNDPLAPIANPDEPITFAWHPYDGHEAASLGDLVANSGMEAAARNSNKLGQSMGHPEQSSVSAAATALTVGISSTQSLGESSNNGEYSSLLITCPSLPITGYIGGAAGSTAALLGVGRVRGNEIKYGFSSELAENWIQLRNPKSITLYQLAIDIKTDTNHDYKGLEPNFSCWLKFRSRARQQYAKQNDVVGVIRA